MSFDIPNLHIPENSPEALAVERVMKEQHLDPAGAILRLLRSASESESAARKLIGRLSSDGDVAEMDAAMDVVREARSDYSLRDTGSL